MKKIVLGVLSCAVFAWTSDIAGSYIAIKTQDGNDINTPYMQTDFSKDGKMLVMGMPMGTWRLDKSKHLIIITSMMNPNAIEKHSIVKQTKDILVLKHNNEVFTYKKLDMNKAKEYNKNSKLEGTWKFNSKSFSEKITFSLPNSFSYQKEDHTENSTTNSNGSWYYDPKEKSLIISSMMCPLAGKYPVEIKNNTITINNITYKKVK